MLRLPIFLAANDAYACFAATTIMSIAEHTDRPLQFHLFSDGISRARRMRLAATVARYNHASLAVHDDLDRRLDACVSDWYRTRAIFARYSIADLFPEYDVSLYVDVDMIFQADVADLFALGTDGMGLAACRDMALHLVTDVAGHKDRLGIPPEHEYFNNGLILIDGRFWRQQRLGEKLTAIALERRGQAVFPSQDPMNILFSPNRYRLLPQRWNVMPSGGGTQVTDPAVLHFTLTKPWNEPTSAGANCFWEVARRSPFAREIGWRRRLWTIVKPARRFRRGATRWMGLRT